MVASLKLTETPAISANNVSYGGGSLDVAAAFMAGLEEQRVLYSTHGFEYTYKEEEFFNNQRIIAAGGEPVELRNEGLGLGAYTEFARAAYADSFASTADDESRTQAQRHAQAINKDGMNDKLEAYKKRWPDAGIKNIDELGASTVAYGAKVAKKASRISGFAGGLAQFAGGLPPVFDPSVNPGMAINLVGGGGKTLVAKLLSEAGLGAVTAGIDEFTGVRENMRLFGLTPSWEQTAMNIGLGAVAPPILHGVARGVRRVVRGPEAAAPPPAPERPLAPRVEPPGPIPDAMPIPPSRAAPDVAPKGPGPVPKINPVEQEILDRHGASYGKRVARDLDDVARQADTYGLAPEDMTPVVEPVGPAVRIKPYNSVDPGWLDKSQVVGPPHPGTLIDGAREIDPEAFSRFDNLTRQLSEAKSQLDAIDAVNRAQDEGTTATNKQLLAGMQRAFDKAETPAAKAAIAKDITDLIDAQPIDNAVAAKRVADVTAKIEGMKPEIERALARAGRAWSLSKTQRQAVNDTIAKVVAGEKVRPFDNVPAAPVPVAPSKTAGLPELGAEPAKPGENYTNVVSRAQDAKDAQLPKQAQEFKASMKRALSDLDKLQEAKKAGQDTTELEATTDYRLAGTEIDIRDVLDIEVDGVKMRQALDDLANDDVALAAITACGVG